MRAGDIVDGYDSVLLDTSSVLARGGPMRSLLQNYLLLVRRFYRLAYGATRSSYLLPRDAQSFPPRKWFVYGSARRRTHAPIERSVAACAPVRYCVFAGVLTERPMEPHSVP